MKAFFALLTILLLSGLAWATVNGYQQHGYTYWDGYWYWGNDAYTLRYVPVASYTASYGCSTCAPVLQAVYSYHHTYTPVPVSTPTYTTPGWRAKLLDIAAARDTNEHKIRASAFEHAYFKEAVGVLGLQGNFHLQNYGVSPFAPGYSAYGANQYGSLQLSTAGAQGSTVYGYSLNTIQSVYGDANLGQLYQQANRLAENAQALAGRATTDFSGLVGQEGSNRAKVAEILAKSQAIREMLQSMEGSGSKTETKIFSYEVKPGPDGKMNIQRIEGTPEPRMSDRAGWETSARTKCFQCHGSGKKEGGFDVQLYPSMSPEQKRHVIGRLTTSDPNKRMPKGGPPLSLQELQMWINN